jgi:hypothetical protein
MSRFSWPEDVKFDLVVLEPEERTCAHCGRFTHVSDHEHRYLRSLGSPLHVVIKVRCCPDKTCPGHAEKRRSEEEILIAPRYWSMSWDLFAWIGHRRFSRHWCVPQILAEMKDRFGVDASPDVIEDYAQKYERMVAAMDGDLQELTAQYRDAEDVTLSIDGLQPEKGHETLYVVRELGRGRIWFAEALLSSAAGEVKRLFERARDIAARIGKPVRCWISDKQDAFVTGVRDVFPGIPHRFCANHFLRDAAKPMLEADSHAKVQMRRKVRGLRNIERKMLEQQAPPDGAGSTGMPATADGDCSPDPGPPPPEAPPPSAAAEVVLDYCAAVRGILNDDQGGPLHPPGVRMAEALGEVRESIERAQEGEKGGSSAKPSPISARASTAESSSRVKR